MFTVLLQATTPSLAFVNEPKQWLLHTQFGSFIVLPYFIYWSFEYIIIYVVIYMYIYISLDLLYLGVHDVIERQFPKQHYGINNIGYLWVFQKRIFVYIYMYFSMQL